MKEAVHPNYYKASNLIFISGGLAVVNISLSLEMFTSGLMIGVAIFTLLFVIGIGFLIRQGYEWVKFLLLVMGILGLFSLRVMINTLMTKPIVGVNNLVQTALQIWSIVLLFQVPKAAAPAFAPTTKKQPLLSVHVGQRVRHLDETKHQNVMVVIEFKNDYAVCQIQDFNNLGIESVKISELTTE